MKMSPINRESHIVNEKNKMYCNTEILDAPRHRLSVSANSVNKFKKSSFKNMKKYTKVAKLLQKDGLNSSKNRKPRKDEKVMSIRDTLAILPTKRLSPPSKLNKSSANENQQNDKKVKDKLKPKRKAKNMMKYQPRAWIISSADVKTAYTPDQNKRLPVKQNSSPADDESLKRSISHNNQLTSSVDSQRSKLKVDRPTTHKQHALVNLTYQEKVKALLFPATVKKQKQMGLNNHKEDQHLASKYDQRPQKVRITFKEYHERKLAMDSYKQPPKINRLIMPSIFTPLVIDVPSQKIDVSTAQKRPAKRSYYDDDNLMLSCQKKRKLD